MLLGFISLFLAVTQDSISKICIPASIADTMLPCKKQVTSNKFQIQHHQHFLNPDFVHKFSLRRLAEEAEVADSCTAKVCFSFSKNRE